jgi:hypothetical protein
MQRHGSAGRRASLPTERIAPGSAGSLGQGPAAGVRGGWGGGGIGQFRAKSAQRVDALVAHAREVENRAHAEVDRAREELKTSVKKVAQVDRVAAHTKRDLNTRLREAREAKAAAEQEAERIKGRLHALEERLVRFESLRAVLERVQRRSRVPAERKPRRNGRLPVRQRWRGRPEPLRKARSASGAAAGD